MKKINYVLVVMVLATSAIVAQMPTPGGGGSGGGVATCGSTDKTLCYNNAGAFGGLAPSSWNSTTLALVLGLTPAAAGPSGFDTSPRLVVTDSAIDGSVGDANIEIRQTGNNEGAIHFLTDEGTYAVPANVTSGDPLGDIVWSGYLNGWPSLTSGDSVRLRAIVDGAPNTRIPGRLEIRVFNANGGAVDYEFHFASAYFPGSLEVNGHTIFEGVTSTGATGTGKLVYDTNPSLTNTTLTADTANQFVQAKVTVSADAPGAGFANLVWRAGTNAGTCKLVGYAGTSSTAVTLVDNVGTGC